MSEVAFPGLSFSEKIFKDLVWDPVITAALNGVFAQNPWLSVWPLGPVIRYLIPKITNSAYSVAVMTLDVEAIKFVNEEHKTAFDKASVTLKIMAQDYGIGSPQFEAANENAKEALAKFVHFSG